MNDVLYYQRSCESLHDIGTCKTAVGGSSMDRVHHRSCGYKATWTMSTSSGSQPHSERTTLQEAGSTKLRLSFLLDTTPCLGAWSLCLLVVQSLANSTWLWSWGPVLRDQGSVAAWIINKPMCHSSNTRACQACSTARRL